VQSPSGIQNGKQNGLLLDLFFVHYVKDGCIARNSVQNFGEISRNSVISPPPKFKIFRNNNLNIFKSIFKNSLKINFDRNFAKFGDFGHVRNFLTNEIQNPGKELCSLKVPRVHA